MANSTMNQMDHLVAYYDDLIEYISQKVGSRQIAIEVVQETYLRILQKPEQFNNLNSPIAFLKKVSFNIALDHIKKDQTYYKYFEHPDIEQQDENAIFTEFSQQELMVVKQQFSQLILQRIDKLPETCRDVFLLIQFYGMSQVEVAEQLHMSRMMVIKHLTKALQSFIPVFNEESLH
ncbi:RNA polymerase sigma factor [Acinetobacter qingfengensis]|uniref:Uncharacterized protein n=1 Tax=Acinetobacter qingfengensis TaxID=1262585 RepID=A0A1E7R0B4_9GAMM|nr:RNA polymerase sigma factor [Acinetobacter qingfengensis]KAA8734561.1 RNA polymerase sigma factor [Acinetobacter qingfengensis]OEY92752.1 hypothetical protein BJI46_14495 [Acinetobacter qingfengensis]